MADPVLQEDVLVNFVVGDERLEAFCKKVAQNVGKLQSETEKLTLGKVFAESAAELMHLGSVMSSLAPKAMLSRSIQDIESILKAVKAIGASAGMTGAQFSEMQTGIKDAAAATGQGFDIIAAHAKDLYGLTGLKEGLGQTILDAERLGQVFDASSGTFSRLTASMIQFGDGTVKADDVMKSFDKVTGLTGKRMDDMLESLGEINKTMRNVLGSGKQYGDAMKNITAFAGQLQAKFTEMGGDGAVLNKLMQDVMDPNKWGEIADKMPGMAGNLYEMQQAMAAGNTERFGELLKQGAQATSDMAAGMPTIAKAASGFDFTSVETLGKMDFKKLGKDANSAGDVASRTADMMRAVGEQWGIFMNNISKSLMPVLQPIIQALSTILGLLNKLMQAGNGWGGIIITWGIMAIGLAITVIALWKKVAKVVVDTTGDVVEKVAEKAGKAVGTTIGTMMDSIGKAVQGAAKYALPMLQVGAALVLFAGAVWILAEALSVLSGLSNLGTVAAGLILIGVAMVGFAVLSAIMAPIAPAMLMVGGALLLFAGSVWVLAKAMQIAAPAFDAMITSLARIADLDVFGIAGGIYILVPALMALFAVGMLWGTAGLIAIGGLYLLGGALAWFASSIGQIGAAAATFTYALKEIGTSTSSLEKLNSMDFTGIKRLAKAMQELGSIRVDTSVSKDSTDSIKGLLEIVTLVANSIVDIITAGRMAIMYASQMSFIFSILFDKESGLLVRAVSQVGEALGTGSFWSSDKSLTKEVMASMTFIVELLQKFSIAFNELATMGSMLYAKVNGADVRMLIDTAIDYIVGTMARVVTKLDEELQGRWNSDLDDAVMKSMTFVFDVIGGFLKIYSDLAVMGAMLYSQVSGANISMLITTAIDYIIGTMIGILQKVDDNLQSWGNASIDEDVMKSMTGIFDIVKNFLGIYSDLAVMGMMLYSSVSGANIGMLIKTSIDAMFGESGFINSMINGIKKQKADSAKINEITASVKSMADMTNPLIDMVSMGALFKGGMDQDLYAYADTIGTFMSKMSDASSTFNKADLDRLTAVTNKMADFGATMNEDLKISAQTGADIALSDHTTATSEHQQSVERLLAEIRDNTSNLGKPASREVAATMGNTPQWQPERLFTDVSETF